MNLSELRTFLTIIETGSLVRASGVLNVTQSTVTARLKSLEDELGQVLIHRKKSGVSLTAGGARLRRYAETISDLWQQARLETALPMGLNDVCNMSSHPDLWPSLGERIFGYLRNEQPHIALSVWQGEHADMAGWLQSGRSDFALTYSTPTNAEQRAFELMTDRLVLVSTIADSPIRFDPNYVFVEGGPVFGREHAAFYADANAARLSFGSAVLGCEFILQNGGTAYLPERIALPHLETEQLHILKSAPVFTRHAFVVVNEAAWRSWPWFDQALDAARAGLMDQPISS
jgi:DNA-binding transcriptional LysR family regulator